MDPNLDPAMDMDQMALLKFKDFVPEQTGKNKWTGRGEYDSLADSLRAANQWMVSHPQIELINIETVVLPSLHSPKEEGSEDPELIISSNSSLQAWHQFIRVWYVAR